MAKPMPTLECLFQGLCSDGLLAWRFYVIFEQRRLALYIPMTFVVINARKVSPKEARKSILTREFLA